MTDTVISQNIDFSSLDTLYIWIGVNVSTLLMEVVYFFTVLLLTYHTTEEFNDPDSSLSGKSRSLQCYSSAI